MSDAVIQSTLSFLWSDENTFFYIYMDSAAASL